MMKTVDEWIYDLGWLTTYDIGRVNPDDIRSIQADARAQGWADALEIAAGCARELGCDLNGCGQFISRSIRALEPGNPT